MCRRTEYCYYNRTGRCYIRTCICYCAVLLLRFRLRHAVQAGRLDRVHRGHRLVASRGRGLEHRQTVRHADANPADRRGRMAEPRVRLLAQG